MRNLNSKALAIGIAAIAASAASSGAGCSATKPTEIVPGALTQVQVPKDLAGIQVEVTANGADKFCQGYVVANGSVELPSTLGVISGAANTTLHVTIRGYDVSSSNDMLNCNHLQVDDQSADPSLGPAPRVLRQAIVTYVNQQTLFLPMPLSFSCYDMDCSTGGPDQTCKAGTCTDGTVPPGSLAPFDPSLVDGTQDCFPATTCMATAAPADTVDPVNCVYSVPQALASTATSSGFNVRLTYTDVTWTKDPGTGVYAPVPQVPIETEILNLDAVEGYAVADPSKPQQFTLAPGLCKLVQAASTPPVQAPSKGTATFHSVSNVDVAAGCPSKQPLLPFCAGDQHSNVASNQSPQVACGVAVPLETTPSALYMVMDDSGAMFGAFGPQGYTTAMNLSFAFPIFKHTYVGFRFLTHDCTTAYTPAIPFGLAPNVQPLVAQKLEGWQAPDTLAAPSDLDLLGAMQQGTETAYTEVNDFAKSLGGGSSSGNTLNVAAVMFFVNRTPVVGGGGAGDGGTPGDYPTTSGECSPSGGATAQAAMTQAAQAAFTPAAGNQSVHTFFVVLNDKQQSPQPQLDFYNGVASAPNSGASVIDATSANPTQVLESFQGTLASIASCLYDLPAGVDNTAALTFSIPPNTPGLNPSSSALPVPIGNVSNCNAANSATANGWGVDNGHIRLCGTACQNLQQTIGAVALAALQGSGDAGAEAGIPTGDSGSPVVPEVPVNVTMPCSTSNGP